MQTLRLQIPNANFQMPNEDSSEFGIRHSEISWFFHHQPRRAGSVLITDYWLLDTGH